MTTVGYVAVPGTWQNRAPDPWTLYTSPISRYLAAWAKNLGGTATMPYGWTTGLDFERGHHDDWIAGGEALFYYLVPPLRPADAWPPAETVVVTHSHGLQVALYAASYGLKIDRLIDIAGPVRADMMDVAKLARPNIRRWLHVHSDCSDKWQWLGEMFDGHLGIVREHPLADINDGVPHVGHAGVLRDSGDFHFWPDRGWTTFLQTGETK